MNRPLDDYRKKRDFARTPEPAPAAEVVAERFEVSRESQDEFAYDSQMKASKAIADGNVEAVYTAKKALVWLELLDEKTADLNAVRMEMIEYIIKIQATMEQ